MEGFIKLFRKFEEWEWYTDMKVKHLFIHLLFKANYKPKRWRGILIKRGQLVTSFASLASQLNMTTKEVRTALSKLERTGEIKRERAGNGQAITVVRYDFYQGQHVDNGRLGADQGQTKGRLGADQGQQHNKDNKENKENKENKGISAQAVFFEFSEYASKHQKIATRDEISARDIAKKINEIEQDSPLELWQQILENLPEWYKQKGFSLHQINNKFGELINEIHNEKSKAKFGEKIANYDFGFTDK